MFVCVVLSGVFKYVCACGVCVLLRCLCVFVKIAWCCMECCCWSGVCVCGLCVCFVCD